MKVPNWSVTATDGAVSLSRLQNEGSQRENNVKKTGDKSIKATE